MKKRLALLLVNLYLLLSVYGQAVPHVKAVDSLCLKEVAPPAEAKDLPVVTDNETPVIWERYFYPRENYPELIRLCGRLNTPGQISSMLTMLYKVEDMLIEYNRPKGKFYMVMAILNDRLDNKVNANKYMILAAQDFDRQVKIQKEMNEQHQFRIYELQSVLLNKQKRSNLLFFLFIGLAAAYIVLNRESKLRHLRKKRKMQKIQDNPDSIDEDLIDKINIAVNMIKQTKNPNLSPDQIEALGFDSKDDFQSSFQLVMGMSPKEFYDKNFTQPE